MVTNQTHSPYRICHLCARHLPGNKPLEMHITATDRAPPSSSSGGNRGAGGGGRRADNHYSDEDDGFKSEGARRGRRGRGVNGDDPAARRRQPGCRRERERRAPGEGEKKEEAKAPPADGAFDCAARKAGRGGRSTCQHLLMATPVISSSSFPPTWSGGLSTEPENFATNYSSRFQPSYYY